MTSVKTGGCLCGEVRYEIRGALGDAYYCHCTDCRKVGGSTFHTGVVVKTDEIAVTSGLPRAYTTLADSGRELTRFFCATCGGGLYGSTSLGGEWSSLKLGSLDDPSDIVPVMEIWTRSEIPAARIPDGIRRYERGTRD